MEKSILLAMPLQMGAADISRCLEPHFNLVYIETPEQCPEDLQSVGLVLVDQLFSRFNAVDFVMSILSRVKIPVIVLCDVENSRFAPEAINAGAFNFIVKTGPYIDLLAFAVRDAIARFSELDSLRSTVLELRSQLPSSEKSTISERSANEAQQTAHEEKILNRDIMQEIVDKLKNGDVNLPAYPHINVRFREMVTEGESIVKISEVLEKDISISSKLISIANSAYYQGMAPAKTLEQAISRVGVSEARSYVELIANRSLYTNQNEKYSTFLEKLWQHSLACAYASRELCRVLYKGDPAEYFSMGLFHDIGKLLLVQIISELENKGAYSSDISDLEWKTIVNKYHGQFGASLMKRWKLSKEYADVALEHENIANGRNVPDQIKLVHVANIISKTMGYSETDDDEKNLLDLAVAEEFGLTSQNIDEIKTHVAELMKAGLVV